MASAVKSTAYLLVGVLIGWVLLPTPLVVCGLYASESAPAWVQAVGSIAAILVAAGIPWFQKRVRRQEEAKQLSISVLRLRSKLESLGRAALDRAANIRGFNGRAASPESVHVLLQGSYMSETNDVESHLSRIHHLHKKIQGPVVELLQENDQYLTDYTRVYETDHNSRVQVMNESKDSLVTRLERVSQLAFAASTAIRLIDERNSRRDE